MEQRAVRLRTLCAAAVVALALAACGSDGPVADLTSATIGEGAAATPTEAPATPETPTATEAPDAPVEPETPVPTDAPVVTDAPAPEPEPAPEDDDGTDPLVTILVVAALLAAVVVVGAAIAKSRKKTPEPAAAPPTPSPQGPLLSTSQWIVDQLSLELMAAPPTEALQRWSVERSRLDNVAIGAHEQFLAGHAADWQPLGQEMSALAAAIDTSLALRAQVPPNAQLISESIDAVNGHRTRLHQLIAVLLPTVDR